MFRKIPFTEHEMDIIGEIIAYDKHLEEELIAARQAVEAAKDNGVDLHVGNVLSADNFYNDGNDGPEQWKKMGVLAVEMEAAGLYMNAARAGKRALGIFTISDDFYKPEELTSAERQSSMRQMITIALDTAVKMAQL